MMRVLRVSILLCEGPTERGSFGVYPELLVMIGKRICCQISQTWKRGSSALDDFYGHRLAIQKHTCRRRGSANIGGAIPWARVALVFFQQ